MRTLILTAALLFAASTTFGQALKKGNLVGVHVMTVDLKPGVTMDQFTGFFTSKVIPEYEKHFKGVKAYLTKSIRGENKDSFGIIFLFKSEQERDKYFNKDGSPNDLGLSTNAKVQPVLDELDKLGTSSRTYTDWIIQ